MKPRTVPATAWIAGDIDPDGEIYEHSIALKSFGIGVVTMSIEKEIRFRFQKRNDEEQNTTLRLNSHRVAEDGGSDSREWE